MQLRHDLQAADARSYQYRDGEEHQAAYQSQTAHPLIEQNEQSAQDSGADNGIRRDLAGPRGQGDDLPMSIDAPRLGEGERQSADADG